MKKTRLFFTLIIVACMLLFGACGKTPTQEIPASTTEVAEIQQSTLAVSTDSQGEGVSTADISVDTSAENTADTIVETGGGEKADAMAIGDTETSFEEKIIQAVEGYSLLSPFYSDLGFDARDLRIQELGDVDGNGQTDYSIVYFYDLWIWLNDCSIFHYEDPNVSIYNVDEIALVDLDGDEQQELFFSYSMLVNSMPLERYSVLKKNGGFWYELQVPDNCGYEQLASTFDFKAVRTGNAEAVISCTGSDKKYTFNFEDYYRAYITELNGEFPEEVEYCEAILSGGSYPVGSTIATPAYWGTWDVTLSECNGKPCLKATQGLMGSRGHFDMWGGIFVYFDYDENGLINILNFVFTPDEWD